MKQLTLLILLCTAVFVFGCGGDDNDDNNGDGEDTGTGSAPFEHVCIPVNDVDKVCEDMVLTQIPFQPTADRVKIYDLAADFTVETTCGTWNFEAGYSGCESYLFITDQPAGIWDNVDDLAFLFGRLPANTQVFFISTAQNPLPALERLETNVNESLERFSEDGREFRQARVHYVTQQLRQIPGWIGSFPYDIGFGVAIDRQQRIRNTGYVGDGARFDPATNTWGSNISMYSNEALYFNFEAGREDGLQSDGATEVSIFDGEQAFDTDSTGQQMLSGNISFPADLTIFDSMELDLYLGCGDGGEVDCPPDNRDVQLFWCDPAVDTDPGADKCSKEIGRWVTPFGREGRWVHDISDLLPLFQGGNNRFSYYSVDGWEVTLKARFSDKDKSDPQPVEVHQLWQERSEFNLTYNDAFDTVRIDIPADAARVELVTVVTGHGISAGDQCGEFCQSDHHFYVDNLADTDSADNELLFPEAGSNYGCTDLVDEGVVPNQLGPWWFGRAGWCPGQEVPLMRLEVTAQITKGASNDFRYEGFFNGVPYPDDSDTDPNNDWRHFWVNTWLVIYK